MDEIRSTIAAMRKSRGVSQMELSRRTGISQRELSIIETGKRRLNPKSMVAIMICLHQAQPLSESEWSDYVSAGQKELSELQEQVRQSLLLNLPVISNKCRDFVITDLKSTGPDRDLWLGEAMSILRGMAGASEQQREAISTLLKLPADKAALASTVVMEFGRASRV